MTRALRVAASACVLLVIYLSLIPKDFEVRTGLPGQIEHVAAYFGAGLLVIRAARPRPDWLAAALLCVLACVLEVLQLWVPGRNSQVIDAVASCTGVLAALGATRLLAGRTGRGDRSPPP